MTGMTGMTGDRGGGATTRAETVIAETVNSETVNSETVNSETVNSETVNSETGRHIRLETGNKSVQQDCPFQQHITKKSLAASRTGRRPLTPPAAIL